MATLGVCPGCRRLVSRETAACSHCGAAISGAGRINEALVTRVVRIGERWALRSLGVGGLLAVYGFVASSGSALELSGILLFAGTATWFIARGLLGGNRH
jgi:hypothetical protein